MATLLDTNLAEDMNVIGSRIGRIDPDNFRNQRDDDINEDDDTESDLDDEPVDADGDPTGEHDHQQDDNYALGGHVTRSGSI
ncbi:hypothetical protein [Spirosoma linguale]|uniref:Uncharacterized protein n=1 Tax=Spirosoma linguale (strain ATCC 33905 / DSM 74 / LMG 10896 / Claus 1) TaxID=504472 RepID=D2QR55_SPILD|nr:hypothetical protein Slin_3602 [Spirosoma linguale DSM 74]